MRSYQWSPIYLLALGRLYLWLQSASILTTRTKVLIRGTISVSVQWGKLIDSFQKLNSELKKWVESSLNWVLEQCSTSYIALICQPRAIPSQRASHPPVGRRNCPIRLLLLELHDLTHIFCSLAHPNQVMSCKDNYWLLSQTFPEMIGGVMNTQHVISTMSFHSRKWDHTRRFNIQCVPVKLFLLWCNNTTNRVYTTFSPVTERTMSETCEVNLFSNCSFLLSRKRRAVHAMMHAGRERCCFERFFKCSPEIFLCYLF